MKAKQHGGRRREVHRCFVVYSLLLSVFANLPLFGQSPEEPAEGPVERTLHDFATVYLDRYFEPEESLLLSGEGKRRSTALAHYALGRSLEAQGRPVEAIEAYRVVLENQPGQHFLARKTAYLLARNGSNDEALKLLEDSLETNFEEPFAHISLAEFLITYQGSSEESRRRARGILEAAVEKFPTSPAVYEPLVQYYLAANQRRDAVALMTKAASLDSKDPVFWTQIGTIAGRVSPTAGGRDEGGDPLVNEIYGKALRFAGENLSVIETVGDYYHDTRQFDDAIDAYSRLIESASDRLDVREKLARVYGASGDEDKVIEILKEIVEIDPESARTHKQLAQIFMRNEDFKAAIPHLRKSLEITKGTPTEFSALAQMMLQSREYEAAVEFLEDAAYLFPDVSEFPYYSAVALSQLERYEESVKQFAKTVELAGGPEAQILNERFYFSYAAAHERMGEFDEAEELFQKSIELIALNDPDEQDKAFAALVYNYLGYMWLENDKNIDEAGELIKTALEMDPASGAITDSLGWFYFKKERYEEARDTLLKAEELVEEPDPVIYDHIGQTYHHLGDHERAVEYLEKAVEMDSESEEFRTRLKEYREGLAAGAPNEPGAKKADSPPGAPEEREKPDAEAPARPGA